MIIQKESPTVGDLVLVRIKKVMPFGAYCELLEYKNVDSYLPIKEVASGWIKNIHEFIKEGQKSVAKVVYIDKEKKAIDVSLKKVTKKEEKDKINDFNFEKRAENFYTQAMTKAGIQPTERPKIIAEISKKYASYNDVINILSENGDPFKDLKIDSKFIEALKEVVSKNIKPKVYIVSYIVELIIYNTKEGIGLLKKNFGDIEKLGVNVNYLGAPRYHLSSQGDSYLQAEEKINKAKIMLEKIPNSTLSMKKDKV
jgi:translation initiation factor 2 subunit 1